MKRTFMFLLTGIVLFLFGCSSGEQEVDIPSDVIAPDSMVSILVDYHLAEGALLDMQQQKINQAQPAANYYAMIFEKHHIDRKQFDHSLQFYSNHPKLYIKIYDDVLAELNRREAIAMQK